MKDLTSGKIGKNMFLFMLPVLFSNLLARVHITIDQIMVGQFLGEVSLASIGSTSSFTTVISSIMWSVDMGLIMYISTLINKENGKKRAVNVIRSYLLIVFIFSTIIVGIVLTLQPAIFSLLKVGQDIYTPAKAYFMIFFASRIFISVKTCVRAVFNFFGKPRFGLKLSILEVFLNIGLNYLFMKIIPLGVFGAGLATTISVGISCAISFICLRFELRRFFPEKTKFILNFREMFSAFKLTFPCMIQQSAIYLCGAIIQPLINNMGTAPIASYAVCSSLYNLCTTFFFSASTTINYFCNQCYASEKYHLLKRGFFTGMLMAIALSALPVLLIMLFPSSVSSIFIKDGSKETFNYVARYILLCFPFLVFAIINNNYHNFFRGVLKPYYGMLGTITYSIARTVATYLLVPSLFMDGVFLGYIISWITEFVLCTILFCVRIKKINQLSRQES